MRITYQLIENYLSQKIPSILISIEENSGTLKYIINVPPTYQRFVSSHQMKFQKGARYLFTKTSTETIAGLTGMMLTMFESGCAYDSKLYIDQKMYEYLEAMRYKMGFKLMPYSYCSWRGDYRLGIRSREKIFQIFEDKTKYFEIFENLQEYIKKNLAAEEVNDSLSHFDLESKTYKDEQLRIMPFTYECNSDFVTNFICMPNKLAGKINGKKLKDLNITGKSISELMKNGSLLLEKTGETVFLEDFKEPDQPSPNLLVLHFNSLESVKLVASNPVLKDYFENPQNKTQSVIHICEHREIVESEDFKILCSRFYHQNPKVEHCIYNREFKNQSDKFEDIFTPTSHMNIVSEISKTFPDAMPNLSHLQEEYLSTFFKQKMFNIENVLFGVQGKPLKGHELGALHCYKKCYQMVLAPQKNVGYKPLPKNSMTQEKLLEEVSQESVKSALDFKSSSEKKFQINPSVVFLGTGSMKPSKHRNVSSIFIEEFTKNNSIMFDCGEGSYYQLFNHYGPKQIQRVVLSTRVIFITHIHSDHNLGILDFIAERNKLMKSHNLLKDNQQKHEKLFLIIPFNVLPWFHSYCEKIQDLYEGCEVVFLQWIRNQPLTLSDATMSKDERRLEQGAERRASQMVDEAEQQRPIQKCPLQESNEMQENQAEPPPSEYLSKLEEELVSQYNKSQPEIMGRFNRYLEQNEIVEFLPVPVVHCPQSHGIVITHKSSVKISYSGDTIPVEEFASAAHNSTLLIHEATFGDDLQNNARLNMHTTVGQAIDIGIKSKSSITALTHFSQRYKSAKDIVNPEFYKTNANKYEYTKNHTIVCFDHLQMRLSDLDQMTQISKVISAMIPNQKMDQ